MRPGDCRECKSISAGAQTDCAAAGRFLFGPQNGLWPRGESSAARPSERQSHKMQPVRGRLTKEEQKTKHSVLNTEFDTMKAVRKLTVVLSLGLWSCFAFAARTPEQSYIDVCRKGPEMPEPVVVVTPRVGAEYVGASVEVTFVVDATGKPTALAVAKAPDATLAAAVVEAVSQWRFKPVRCDGVPVATKVVLPVRIEAAALAGVRYTVK